MMLDRRKLIALSMAAMLVPSGMARALGDVAIPGVTRRYVPSRFGQLHLRVAVPQSGRIEAPPLVLLHQTPLSGRMFDTFLPFVANNRIAIAVDTPGYGESDRPEDRPGLSDYGDCILDALVEPFGEKFDVLGYHTGAMIAAELAARRSAIERVVLVSMPLFAPDRRAEISASITEKYAFSDDGSHLDGFWMQSFNARAEGQSLEQIARLVAEKHRPGPYTGWAISSALEQDLAPVVRAIRAPTLVIAPHDGLETQSENAASLIPDAKFIAMPDVAYGLFDAIPEQVAAPVNQFLAR